VRVVPLIDPYDPAPPRDLLKYMVELVKYHGGAPAVKQLLFDLQAIAAVGRWENVTVKQADRLNELSDLVGFRYKAFPSEFGETGPLELGAYRSEWSWGAALLHTLERCIEEGLRPRQCIAQECGRWFVPRRAGQRCCTKVPGMAPYDCQKNLTVSAEDAVSAPKEK